MTKIKRTTPDNPDFAQLVKELDAYLKVTDGAEHDFYHQFNGITSLQYVVVAYVNDQAVGCGALKEFNTDTLEIKRMYLKLANRRSGIATEILNALEVWAKELRYQKIVLETGTRQVEALKFYHKSGYHRTPNYAPYAHMENGNCFEKNL